jgi:benzaldehyde dehydrogenase (NAD)
MQQENSGRMRLMLDSIAKRFERDTADACPLLGAIAQQGQIFVGEWKVGGDGARDVAAPASGVRIGSIGLASIDDLETAASRATDAQRSWAKLSHRKRAEVLRLAGSLWRMHEPEIRDWIVRETGGVAGKALREIQESAEECFHGAALAVAPSGDVLRSDEPRLSFSRRAPVGVVGVITPFNFPVILAMRSVAPALALGNAVILKPDSRTAISGGLIIARIFELAGLPAGVLHVLPGDGDIGAALVEHPSVSLISFTGSTAAGAKVSSAAAAHHKKVHLELGGNNALIVCRDVDLEKAVACGMWGSFNHQGQICMATGRHIVHASLARAYAARMAERADRLPVGDPASGDVALGPLIDTRQRDRVHQMVSDSIAGGAELLAGGTFEGLYYRPTVLFDAMGASRCFNEEIFGPVAVIRPFETDEDAARIASSTSYGLVLGILTNDVMNALRLSELAPTGMVHINDQTVADEPNAPFGGLGHSGSGGRFGGFASNLDAFTNTQWVTIRAEIAGNPFTGG